MVGCCQKRQRETEKGEVSMHERVQEKERETSHAHTAHCTQHTARHSSLILRVLLPSFLPFFSSLLSFLITPSFTSHIHRQPWPPTSSPPPATTLMSRSPPRALTPTSSSRLPRVSSRSLVHLPHHRVPPLLSFLRLAFRLCLEALDADVFHLFYLHRPLWFRVRCCSERHERQHQGMECKKKEKKRGTNPHQEHGRNAECDRT